MSLRVELNRSKVEIPVLEPLDSTIVDIRVGDLASFRKRFGIDTESMVLVVMKILPSLYLTGWFAPR